MSARRHCTVSLATVCAAALVLAGCATSSGDATEDAAASSAHSAPRRPTPTPAGFDETLRLADERLAAHDDAGAMRLLAQGIAARPEAQGSDLARLRLAELERKMGRIAAASATLAPLRADRLAPGDRRRALRLLATLAREQGDAVTELALLARLRAETGNLDDLALVDVAIDERISRMSVAELHQSAAQLGERTPAARVRLRQADIALDRHELGVALLALAQASRLPLSPDESGQLDELERRAHALEEAGVDPGLGTTIRGAATLDAELPAASMTPAAPLPETAGARGVIGVVLPLTGAMARFGEQSLSGVLLAANLFGPEAAANAGLRLLVRNTGSDPAGAAAAVSELGANPDVLAVIGPVTADEAEAAAVAAEAVGVPLLALSPRESVSEGRPHVLRLGVTPRAEAEALAAYAVGGLGLRRIAVLRPEDAYGRGLAPIFEQAVRALGGEITGAGSYEASTVDFGETLRHLAGGRLPTDEQPDAPFDALFVPDTRDRIGVIAPQMAVHHLGNVRLLLSRGAVTDSALRESGRALEGAIVAEPFDPGGGGGFVEDFVRRHRAGFARDPDVFAAQAYDATVLALAELARGAADRDTLLRGLTAVVDSPGVAGATTVLPDGNSQKRSSLLAVRGGTLVRLGSGTGR